MDFESQISACRKFRDRLLRRGIGYSYEEYAGGHKLKAWEQDLTNSLTAIVRLLKERNNRLDVDRND